MLSELTFLKWVVFFEQNCIVKWVIFVASFCWFWDSKSELIYKFVSISINFRFSGRVSKPTPNKRFWIIYVLAQISFFETVLEPFSQCKFKIFHCQPTMMTNIFTHPPSSFIKKVPMTRPCMFIFHNYFYLVSAVIQIAIVCIGVSNPPQKYHPLFFHQAPP